MSSKDLISLRQIQYFVSVCDQGTVSGAAAAMNISQPALGMQIKHLEETLGVRLFNRNAQGVTPTPAGVIFEKSARKMLALLKGVRREMTALSDSGDVSITLGITTTSGNELASLVLGAANAHSGKRHYRISFREGKSDELLSLLHDGKIDAALSYEDISKAYDVTPLYDEEFVLVGAPTSLKGLTGSVTLKQVQSLPLVGSPAEQGSRRFLRQVAAKRGTTLNVDVEMSSISLKRQILLNHGKCMIVPTGRFLPEIERGQLGVLRFQPRLSRTMKLFLSRSIDPSTRNFLKAAIINSVKQRINDRNLGWSSPVGKQGQLVRRRGNARC